MPVVNVLRLFFFFLYASWWPFFCSSKYIWNKKRNNQINSSSRTSVQTTKSTRNRTHSNEIREFHVCSCDELSGNTVCQKDYTKKRKKHKFCKWYTTHMYIYILNLILLVGWLVGRSVDRSCTTLTHIEKYNKCWSGQIWYLRTKTRTHALALTLAHSHKHQHDLYFDIRTHQQQHWNYGKTSHTHTNKHQEKKKKKRKKTSIAKFRDHTHLRISIWWAVESWLSLSRSLVAIEPAAKEK